MAVKGTRLEWHLLKLNFSAERLALQHYAYATEKLH